MADFVFNIAKGRIVEFYNRVENNDPANAAFIWVLLESAEADSVLIDYDDLGALLGAAGNVEGAFTNYARIVVTDVELAALPAPDDVNDRYDVDIPDPVWTSAGNGVNETLAKLLICYDSDTTSGTDSNILPVGAWDFVVTTNGNNLTGIINTSGFFRAA